jgi:hypothetical protein
VDPALEARSIGALASGARHRLGKKWKGALGNAPRRALLTDAELLDDFPITHRISLPQIVQKASAVPNDLEQAKA